MKELLERTPLGDTQGQPSPAHFNAPNTHAFKCNDYLQIAVECCAVKIWPFVLFKMVSVFLFLQNLTNRCSVGIQFTDKPLFFSCPEDDQPNSVANVA